MQFAFGKSANGVLSISPPSRRPLLIGSHEKVRLRSARQ
jgi:hypothetical protein